MWSKISQTILKGRIFFLSLIAIITAFMGYKAKDAEMAYNFAKVIPVDNPIYVDYLRFKEKFGEDGNTMVIGVQPKDIFDEKFFNAWQTLGRSISNVDGVTEVLSIGKSFTAVKDSVTGKLNLHPIFPDKVLNQHVLDSLKTVFFSLPFYSDRLYNPETNATLMAVRISQQKLDSKDRIQVVNSIKKIGGAFGELTGLEVHYSGLPLIRTVLATQVADELKLFLLLAVIATGIVLMLLLRSFFAVLFSMMVVGIAVVWSLGTIVLFGYKISLLTGLIPPLIVVIGITNCVYLLNKYHIEFIKLGDKMSALRQVVEKIGLATLFTNLTAAIGFGVFFFTKSAVLKEFGLVAGLNISGIFIISVILIPCVFSYLPAPKKRHTNYLDYKFLNWFLGKLDYIVHNHRRPIYSVTVVLVVLSLIGMTRLTATGYIVDDIPHDDKIYTDLKFFESAFHGIMPFEVMVEGKEKNALKKGSILSHISQLQDTIATYPVFSKPLSIIEAIKFVNQINAGGNPDDYKLQSRGQGLSGVDMNTVVFTYLTKLKDKRLVAPFVDSMNQTARISLNMADIGSLKMREIVNDITPKINAIIDTSRYKVTLTGTSIVFLEGNRFIIDGLIQSLLLAFLLIAICMGYLFRSMRMIVFSMLPNLVPLIITAGLMGYFGIPLKPSTVLIYSIAFGIAIDNAIRFLAKYQQELHRHDWNISQTVSMALHEAGISIIYTSVILFFGFIIFTASSFGGTFYLGLLTSITLVVAMFNNLLLLPSMLLSLEKWADRRALNMKTPADHVALADDDMVERDKKE